MMSSFNKDIRKRRSKSLGDTLLTQKRIKSSLSQMPKGCLKSPSRSMLEDNNDSEFGITMSEKKKRRRSVGRRVSFASKTRVRVFEKNSKFSTPQTRKLSFHDDSPEFRFVDNNDSPLKLQNINSISKLNYNDNYVDKHGVIHFDSDSDRQNSNLSSDNSETHLLDNENREKIIIQIMDKIASKNEKAESINSMSSKSVNNNFKEINEFNSTGILEIANKDDKNPTDSNINNNDPNININNTNNNINTIDINKKEKENENKGKDIINNDKEINNVIEIDNENESTNESDSKGDISGIIVGADNENYNINSQKSIGEPELEEKMDDEILSNQGFDDIPTNNNIINNKNNNDNNNDDNTNKSNNNNNVFYGNSEEEFTATMELTQPYSNAVNVDDTIHTDYSDNISIANQLINKPNSQIKNINNLSNKKNIEFKLFKENHDTTTQSSLISFNNLPIHDETLHTEVMDIDVSLSMNKSINPSLNDNKSNKKEENITNIKLFSKDQSLKDILNKNDKKIINNKNELNSYVNHNNDLEYLPSNEHLSQSSQKSNEKPLLKNGITNLFNKEDAIGIELTKKSDDNKSNNNNDNNNNNNNNLNENKSNNNNENDKNNLMDFFSNRSSLGSRKDSRLFNFSSQQSNLSILTDDQINDSYDDYNRLIKDIADRIPDSPGSLNGTQSDYILSQQSDNGINYSLNGTQIDNKLSQQNDNRINSSKGQENRISKIDLLLKNREITQSPMNNENNKESKNNQDLSNQLEKDNEKRLEKLNDYEHIYKNYENEDESYNFMSSYGKDRKKKIENSANFILKNDISDIEKLNKDDDSITDRLLRNRYKQQSEFLSSKQAVLRRISSMGPYNDEGDDITKIDNKNITNEDDNEEQAMDITVGVGSILSTNKVNTNNKNITEYNNSGSNKENLTNEENTDTFSIINSINANINSKDDEDKNKLIRSEPKNSQLENNNKFVRPESKSSQSESESSLINLQNLLLMRKQNQKYVVNEFNNIHTPIKNSILSRSNQNNNDQKENNVNAINRFTSNNIKLSNKIEEALFQNHTLDERDLERNNSIRLSSTIDVLPTVSPFKRYSILPTRATPSNKRQSRSYSIFNEIIQTPRSLRQRKRQQDLLNDSVNSYNSISLSQPINVSTTSNITNTQEVESPTVLLGNEELGHEENILNEELNIPGGDISISEDLSPEERTVTLSRYLQLVGIQFKNDFEKKPERKSKNLELNNEQMSEVEKLKSMAVYVQELEGLQYECNDIQKSIKECKNILDNYDQKFLKSLPVAFQDYNNAIDDDRKELQQKFKTTQEYSRLKAKQAWYRWRTSMCNGMVKKYKKLIDLFKMDMEKINEYSSEISKYVPSMKIFYNQLMETIDLNKSQEILSESFEERMALLEKKIHEQKQIILKLGTETKSYEEEKKISLKKVDEMKNTIDELKDIIDQYEERIKKMESSIYTKETLQKSKNEHNLIVNVSNWNIKSLSPDLLSYVYDDIILVSFNRRNQNDFVYDVNLDFINLEKTKYRIDIEKFKPVIKGIQNKFSACKNDKAIRKTLDEVAYYWNKLTKLFQDIELVSKTNIVEIYTADSKDIESKEISLSMQSNTTIVRIVFFDGKQKYRYFVDFFINNNIAYPYGKLNWRFIYKYGSVKYELVKQIINDTPKGNRRLEEICRNLRTIQV